MATPKIGLCLGGIRSRHVARNHIGRSYSNLSKDLVNLNLTKEPTGHEMNTW